VQHHNDINRKEDIQMQDNEKLEAGAASDLNAKLDCVFDVDKKTGVPCLKLRKIKRHKTYCVFWSEGSLTCYDAFNFKKAIGNRLDDELIILWNNAKNRLGKKAEFMHGGVTGTMTHIPHDLALSVFNAIKDRFANALKAI
jgi:hypothetical protein